MAGKSASRKLGAAYLVVVFLTVFIVVTQLFGVPLGWLFGPVPAAIVPPTRSMDVQVNPATPILPGQEIRITVVDKENHFPIQAAIVGVSKDGSKLIDLYTDEDGLVITEYPGEVTIITVRKEGYSSVMKVVPRLPVKWIMGIITGIGLASVSAGINYWFLKKRKKKKG